MNDCILPEKPNPKKSRAALVQATGVNPKAMYCCHRCPNDSHHGGCINPDHLYWGTPSQNRHDHYQSDRAQETRCKLSESRKDIKFSEETRQKMSEAWKVRREKGVSEETKRKMSESAKRRRLRPKARE